MTLLSEYRPGDTIRGVLHECACCGAWFVGRSDAAYCSTSCRVKAHRREKAAE